jgi:NADH-quinone oxidoreductase subunit G
LPYAETEDLAKTLANLLLLKNEADVNHVGRANNGLVAVWPHNNTQGAWDMGVRPDAGPGYTPLETPGMGAREIYDAVASGDLQALYVMGTDPVGDGLLDGRGGLQFLVVQELFLTETAKVADVVLPAQSWAERDGTFTSGERRVQRFYPAIPVVGAALPDWQILARVGERLDLGAAPYAAGLAFRELAGAVAPYAGITYRALGKTVEQWPRVGGEDLYFGGTSYDNKSGIGIQWPAAAEAEEAALPLYDVPAPAATAQDDRGLPVVVARALYEPGTLIDHTALLASRIVQPQLRLHPDDAPGADVATGDVVTASLDGHGVRLEVVVDPQVPAGVAVVRGVRLAANTVPLRITEIEKVAGAQAVVAP